MIASFDAKYENSSTKCLMLREEHTDLLLCSNFGNSGTVGK